MGDENFDFELSTPVDLPTAGCKVSFLLYLSQLQVLNDGYLLVKKYF